MKENDEFKAVSWLNEISPNNVELVGQKAVRLALLYKQKLPVPPGFVITSDVFKKFVSDNELMPSIKAVLFNIKASSALKINESSKRIHSIISESPFPRELTNEIYESYEILHPGKKGNALSLLDKEEEISVAVRSSLVHEGLKGYAKLNISGKENLIEAVKECFSALFSPDNLEKWDSKYINEGIAVIVQPMINIEKEGISYLSSSHNNPYVVEALRKDSVDEKHLLNSEFSILKDKSSEQEDVLSPHEIKRAAIYAEELTKKSGSPRQVSFGYSEGNLYILDSVPYKIPETIPEETQEVQEDKPDDSQKNVEKIEEVKEEEKDESDFFFLLHSSMIREVLRKKTRYRFDEKPEVLLALSETHGESEDIEAQVLKALESAKLADE